MARPSEYDFKLCEEIRKEDLHKYNGLSVIYGLYTDKHGLKYIGHSKDVRERFYNHIRNDETETNRAKYNWIKKYKNEIKIKILSSDHKDWEQEERIWIAKYKDQIVNICAGGKDNFKRVKPMSEWTCEDYLNDTNRALRELNRYYKSKGKQKQFELLSKEEIKTICAFKINNNEKVD